MTWQNVSSFFSSNKMKGEKVEKPTEGNVRDILYFDIYSQQEIKDLWHI